MKALDFTTIQPHATTNATNPSNDSIPSYEGYICAVVAVVLYGSNFVPVKKYHTGDGMFFQWILCSGIFLSGLVLQMADNSTLYILPMLGGAIWAVGNLCVVPVIKTIGMGLGLSIWGTCALCIGWAIGRFGLFGTEKAKIDHFIMNDFSVILAFVSIIILINVKNEVSASNLEIEIVPEENKPLLDHEGSINGQSQSQASENHLQAFTDQLQSLNDLQSPSDHLYSSSEDILVFKSQNPPVREENNVQKEKMVEDEPLFFEKFSETKKRIIGSVLSVFSGLMYGVNFTPTLYTQHHYKKASQNGLDYVFAQFCGIYLASTVFFVIYCIFKKNKPQVYPQVIVPGLISGILWAVATACWNVANSALSQAISFPIVATGPCGLASLFWGVLVFGEIRGFKNICILVAGFLVNLTGSLLAGFSK